MYEYVVILVVIGANLKVFIHSILQIKNAKQIQVDRYRCFFVCVCLLLCLCSLLFLKKIFRTIELKG